MKYGYAISHTRGRDQAIQRLPDRETCAARFAIQLGGEREIVKVLESQNRKGTEVLPYATGIAFLAKTLQNLGEDHVSQGERGAILEQFRAARGFGRVHIVENVDPNAGVDDYHALPDRLTSRSPSQCTLPFNLSSPSLRYRATSSLRARSTASRLVLAPVSR